MNIRDYLSDLHPEMSLVSDPERIEQLFARIWGVKYHGYTAPSPSPLARDVKTFSLNEASRECEHRYPVGLAICTWNRPLYLEPCLNSVKHCDLSNVITVLVDDASGDSDTLNLIREFDLDTPLIKIYKTRRRQIHHSLDLAWCLLKGLGCRYLANLDGDAIVSPSWLGALQSLHRRLDAPEKTILSAFNKDADSSVIEEAEDYRIKRKLGGICYFFQSGLLSSIRPLLFDIAWDNLVGGYFTGRYADGYRLICTRPSYVQHIGAIGMNSGPHKQFDYATDFVGSETTSVRERG